MGGSSRLESLLSALASRTRIRPLNSSRSAKLNIESLESRLALTGMPVISEFMAANDNTITDGAGNHSDWIEIYNPTDAPINLAGWHLTDNADNLDKWTFPALPQSILDPGEYLLVFASGQVTETYIDPLGYLHTDFALSADGEYLALTDSNEEVVYSFAPTYPTQIGDVSYGLIQNTQSLTLVGSASTVSARVPTSGTLDAPNTSTSPAWTLPSFNDSAWTTVSTGSAVGFDTGTDEVNNVPNGTLLPGGPIGFDLTDQLNDGTLDGTFTAGGNSPGGEDASRLLDNNPATKWLAFEPAGTFYQFQFANDTQYAVNGYTLTSANDADERDPYSWTLRGSNDGINWTLVDTRTAQDFAGRGETRLYEFANNTVFEFYRFDFQTRWGATGNGGQPNSIQIGELELLSTGPVDYNPLLDINLATPWNATKSSVYQRIEFNVTDPASYASLQLAMQYDDGFVAYLNGTRIASANAPTLPNWQSHSTAEQEDGDALSGQSFNITQYLHLLVPGQNVLAIHVLNTTDADPDLLSVPTLTAVRLIDQTVSIGFMPDATPGAANSNAGVSSGPVISEVTDNPTRPLSDQNLVITARVAQAGAPISSVTLTYRVMFGANVPLTMLDNGLGSDAVAGDGVYTAVIPETAYSTGQMVRWYVTATDTVADASRYPLFLSPTNSPEYLGTVVIQPGVSATLPVFEYFVENVAASGTETGTRASVFFLGEFYDNVFVRRRGGNTTQGRKFEFNDGHHFLFDAAYGRVDEINLNERGGDPTYMRQVLSWELYAAAGLPASLAQAWYTRINDQYLDVRIFVEQPDSDLLERTGLDTEGALYKIGRDGVENSVTSSTQGVGKRTRQEEDNSDLQALVNGVSPSNPNRTQYVFDNVDIAAVINYLAVTSLVHDNDSPHKNYHLYRDTEGSGQWRFLPWDKDLTFGLNFGISGIIGNVDPYGHPFFGDEGHQKIDGQWNRLIDAVLDIPLVREMYVRRLRSLMDQFLLPPGSGQTSWIENRIAQLTAALSPHVGSTGWQNNVNLILNEYLPERRQHLYIDHSINNPGYPDNAAIPNAQVGNPLIQFSTIDYNPVGGNQDQEYIKLVNPGTTAVDISGWRITGSIDYTFRAGTVIAAGGSLYVAADVPSFLARTTGPRGGQNLFVQGNYEGRISSQGASFALLAASGASIATATTPADPLSVQSFIRISEINYHPHDITTAELTALPGTTEDDFDFIEIVNTHPTDTVNLQGMQLANGVSYTFGNVNLAPGQRRVIVENAAAFAVRYQGVSVLGTWSGALSNSGETVELLTSGGGTVMSVAYADLDPWTSTADGSGGTLELISPSGSNTAQFSRSSAWRASSEYGGTPGTAGIGSRGVVINEVLANSGASGDSIELRNTTSSAINIGGWYISDSEETLKKFQIPLGTLLPAGGFIVFTETQFNPASPAPGQIAFGIDGTYGESIYVYIPNAQGNIVGIADSVHFTGTFGLQTLGRVDAGSSRLQPQATSTLGSANSAPSTGALVISEVNYAPPAPSSAALAIDPTLTAADLEFIELYNSTGQPIALGDYSIAGAVSVDFAPGSSVAASSTVVVVRSTVASNPTKLAAFRAHFGISAAVAVTGGLTGALPNDWGKVELLYPGTPAVETPAVIPQIRGDEVVYDTLGTWSVLTAGQSLSRRASTAFGDYSTTWAARAASPGSVSFTIAAGDFDADGGVDLDDFNLLVAAISSANANRAYDLNNSGSLNAADAAYFVKTIVNPVGGDYNFEGSVTAADKAQWRAAFGSSLLLNADGNRDGVVDAADYNIWRDMLGYTAPAAVAAPATESVAPPSLAAAVEEAPTAQPQSAAPASRSPASAAASAASPVLPQSLTQSVVTSSTTNTRSRQYSTPSPRIAVVDAYFASDSDGKATTGDSLAESLVTASRPTKRASVESVFASQRWAFDRGWKL